MGAAQYLHVPGYAALILRRNFSDLMQADALIPRSLDWWTRTNAKWNATNKQWTFPCPGGGTSMIKFGFCDNESDIYQYQSSSYAYIGWDELTHFSESQYRYLFSRQSRNASGPLADVPLRVRSASNPGGVGHSWVKSRFISPETKIAGAVFVPSKLRDNPTVDPDTYIESLDYLDPKTRSQLLEGDWEAETSGRFKLHWVRRYSRYGTAYTVNGKNWEPYRLNRFLTVDPAATVPQTAKSDPDWTVVSAWAQTPPGDLLWLGCIRARVEVPDILPMVAKMYKRFDCGRAFIEGGGPQKGVSQFLRRATPKMNIVELNPRIAGQATSDKLVRATPLINMAEGGRFWMPPRNGYLDSGPLPFPAGTVTTEDAEDELSRFTGDTKQSGHDDIVDTAAWAARVVEGKANSAGFAPTVYRS